MTDIGRETQAKTERDFCLPSTRGQAHSTNQKTRKRMPLSAIFGALLRPVSDWWARIWTRPGLRLIYDIYPDTKGIRETGNIRLLIKNTGKGAGIGAVVDLFIHKPREIYPGHGLLFNKEIGSLERARSEVFGDTIEDDKPRQFRYRLKPGIFINPNEDPLEIAHLPVVAFRDTDPSEKFDCEIAWEISVANVRKKTGRITLEGSEVRQRLLSKHD